MDATPDPSHQPERKLWDAYTLIPGDLPPAFTFEASIPDAAREDLNYMCELLHRAIRILDERTPLTFTQICCAMGVSEAEFRSVWAVHHLGGYEALRQEALRPTFWRRPNDRASE